MHGTNVDHHFYWEEKGTIVYIKVFTVCLMKSKKTHDELNGWKLQKFHDMLHKSRDMEMFGCPQNWDAHPGEHNLVDFAK